MDKKKPTSNNDCKTIESRPGSPRCQNPEFVHADSEGNGLETIPESRPHSSYEDVPGDGESFIIQGLPEPIPCTTSSEDVEFREDASCPEGGNGQATPTSAIDGFVQPRDSEGRAVHQNMQYNLDKYSMPLPRATAFLTHNDVTLTSTLHCSSEEELPNFDATEGAVVPVGEHFHQIFTLLLYAYMFICSEEELPNLDATERAVVPVGEHFHHNVNKPGYIVYSFDLQRFSGDCQYLLPKKKAEDDRIGGCRTSTQNCVFTMFHVGKEYAVKKAVYRSEDVSVYSRLCHPNIVNLEAVLIGDKHECLKNQFYAYHFMTKMDVNLKKALSANQDGCLRYFKRKEQWEMVLCNTKHILKCVLKAINYMRSQGVALKDIKASNILINMDCPCVGDDVLSCCCCRQAFAVKLSLSSSMVTGYDSLYADGTDARLFGRFLLDVLMGKSAQGYEDPQDVCYTNFLLSELERCYGDIPELCDLGRKCFQVGVLLSAKDLLQSKFLN